MHFSHVNQDISLTSDTRPLSILKTEENYVFRSESTLFTVDVSSTTLGILHDFLLEESVVNTRELNVGSYWQYFTAAGCWLTKDKNFFVK